MDSGLEERILPSIRRSQMLLIYRNGGVVGQVAHFNLTPEASLCRGFYLLPFVLSKGWRAQMETCGQIACSVEVIRRMETFGQNPCEVGRPRKIRENRPFVLAGVLTVRRV